MALSLSYQNEGLIPLHQSGVNLLHYISIEAFSSIDQSAMTSLRVKCQFCKLPLNILGCIIFAWKFMTSSNIQVVPKKSPSFKFPEIFGMEIEKTILYSL